MGNLKIYFTESDPAPTNGYLVRYRKVGDAVYTTLSPSPMASPATVLNTTPLVSYEGTIQSDCSNGVYSSPAVFTVNPCVGDNIKVIGEECETGARVNISSTDNGAGTWNCTYWYVFSDGSHSSVFSESTMYNCLLA